MCSRTPRAAVPFCSPSSPIMPMPTRMKPICDMDEQASVRLRSTLNTASTAPSSIVTVPSASTTRPHAAS